MLRLTFRALALGSLAAALLLVAPHTAVLAEDGAEPAPAPAGIQWVEGWEAGMAQAKKDGRLIFLYFGRHSPH